MELFFERAEMSEGLEIRWKCKGAHNQERRVFAKKYP